MRKIVSARFSLPIRKFSGLISLWIIFFECMYCILERIWSPIMSTDLSDNLPELALSSSSRVWPR